MKKETCDRILHAYDETFTLLGFEDFAKGIRYICSEMVTQLQKLRQGRSRTGMEAIFMKEPEPTPEKLEAALQTIRLLPYQLRKGFPQIAKEVSQKLPRLRGGRPRRLTPEDCKHACREIGRLLGDGLSLPDAEMRVAQRKGVSVRTIARAWQKRSQLTLRNK
jgi:hypothetical protein